MKSGFLSKVSHLTRQCTLSNEQEPITSLVGSKLPGEMKKKFSISDFLVERKIGEGNFSEIFCVTHLLTGEEYALKVFQKAKVERLCKINEVQMERTCLLLLNNPGHPGIIRLIDTFRDDTHVYILYELAKKGDLWEMIKNIGIISISVARHYIFQLLDALEYVHSLNIMHRDLKAENLVIKDSQLKIIDFGSAGFVKENFEYCPEKKNEANSQDISTINNCRRSSNKFNFRRNRFVNYVGTPQFMPPEAIRNLDSGKLRDFWSLGCTIYQFLVGSPAFCGSTEYFVCNQVLRHQVDFPKFFPADAKDLVKKLLDPNPLNRLGAKGGVMEIRAHPFFNNFVIQYNKVLAINSSVLCEAAMKFDFLLSAARLKQKNARVTSMDKYGSETVELNIGNGENKEVSNQFSDELSGSVHNQISFPKNSIAACTIGSQCAPISEDPKNITMTSTSASCKQLTSEELNKEVNSINPAETAVQHEQAHDCLDHETENLPTANKLKFSSQNAKVSINDCNLKSKVFSEDFMEPQDVSSSLLESACDYTLQKIGHKTGILVGEVFHEDDDDTTAFKGTNCNPRSEEAIDLLHCNAITASKLRKSTLGHGFPLPSFPEKNQNSLLQCNLENTEFANLYSNMDHTACPTTKFELLSRWMSQRGDGSCASCFSLESLWRSHYLDGFATNVEEVTADQCPTNDNHSKEIIVHMESCRRTPWKNTKGESLIALELAPKPSNANAETSVANNLYGESKPHLQGAECDILRKKESIAIDTSLPQIKKSNSSFSSASDCENKLKAASVLHSKSGTPTIQQRAGSSLYHEGSNNCSASCKKVGLLENTTQFPMLSNGEVASNKPDDAYFNSTPRIPSDVGNRSDKDTANSPLSPSFLHMAYDRSCLAEKEKQIIEENIINLKVSALHRVTRSLKERSHELEDSASFESVVERLSFQIEQAAYQDFFEDAFANEWLRFQCENRHFET